MLDTNLHGHIERISPEAPVPVVRIDCRSATLGGAGNVAHNVIALGHPVRLLGVKGDDATGDELEGIARRKGLGIHLISIRDRPTTCKTRVFGERNHQVLRLDSEIITPLGPSVENDLIAYVQRDESDWACVILSDYAKGVCSDLVLRNVLDYCCQQTIPAIVDPKSGDPGRYRGATMLTPNLRETAIMLKVPKIGNCDEAAARAAVELREQSGAENVLVTRGDRGMTLATPNDTRHYSAVSRQVADVTGAGDTVVAMIAVSLSEGHDVAKAVERSNEAASLAVSKPGTQPVTRKEFDNFAIQNSATRKIRTWEEADAVIRQWKSEDETVVFTNGCFDLLHAGHLFCLEQARTYGGRLVVGLNSDCSVKAIKGPQRPIVAENHRAALLAGLECVDAVVLFDQDTPTQLIQLLRPQVLVKGGEYQIDQIPGARFVVDNGGRVVRIPMKGQLSTTKLLAAARLGQECATNVSLQVDAG